LEMATQTVHFTECNGLCRQCSGGVLPQKMLFLSSRDPTTENVPRSVSGQEIHDIRTVLWIAIELRR